MTYPGRSRIVGIIVCSFYFILRCQLIWVDGPSNGPTTGSNITVTETAQATLASAQHAAEKAFLAAEQYIPQSLMDRLQGVIRKSAEFAWSDLPQGYTVAGIQNDKSSTMSNGKPSLPSQESESNFEPTHTGGVGSLPGGRNEEGIARLPHERKMDASASTGAPETQKYPPQKTSIDPPAGRCLPHLSLQR